MMFQIVSRKNVIDNEALSAEKIEMNVNLVRAGGWRQPQAKVHSFQRFFLCYCTSDCHNINFQRVSRCRLSGKATEILLAYLYACVGLFS